MAGKRKGLQGERSGLFSQIIAIAHAIKPTWGLFENVPGLFSSHAGRDMATVLEGLRECWNVVGWRVLDSRYFHLAQRRERVFFVCGPTERSVEEVLFESESSGRDLTTGGETGAHVASSLRSRSKNIGQSNGEELNDSTEAHAYEVLQSVRCKVGEKEMERWGLGVVARFRQSEILQSELHGGELRRKASVANVMLGDGSLPFQEDDRAGAMPKMQDQKGAACASQKWKLEGQLTSEFREIVSQLSRSSPQQKGIMRALWRASEGIGVLRTALSEIQEAWRSDLHQDQAATLRSRNSSPGVNPPGRGGEDDMNVVCAPLNHSPYGDQQGDESKLVVAATLKQRMRGCTDEVMDTLQVVQALKNLGSGGPDDNEAQAGHLVTHTLRGEGFDASEDGTGRGTPLVPIAEVGAKTQMGGGRNGCGIGQPGDPMFTLQAGKQHAVGVRRLTPTETERLQGFLDGWTCLCQPLESYDSNRCTCPDGHRYQAMGNAVSVPVIEWIGKRLKQQERSL